MDNELNYNYLVFRHLDRLSQVTTGYMVSSQEDNDGQKPKPISMEALKQGVTFLGAIIPSSFKSDPECQKELDETWLKYKNGYEKIISQQETFVDIDKRLDRLQELRDYRYLRVYINLLDRKGLLLPHKIQASVASRGKKKDEAEVKQEWEDA